MPKRGYDTCIDIMEHIRKHFKGKTKISLFDLEFAIKRIAGLSHPTVENYKKNLREFKWIGNDGYNIIVNFEKYEKDREDGGA